MKEMRMDLLQKLLDKYERWNNSEQRESSSPSYFGISIYCPAIIYSLDYYSTNLNIITSLYVKALEPSKEKIKWHIEKKYSVDICVLLR